MYDDFFLKAAELTRAGEPFATATVVRAERPTSGKPGDRAIVTRDGVMHGWVGGSCAQPTVIHEALEAIADGEARLIRLSPEPGAQQLPAGYREVPMVCFSGGTLDVYIEPQQPRPVLAIFGGLPVAQALVHLGQAMNYRVVAVPGADEASSMAHADTVLERAADVADYVTPMTFVVVATHGHFDEDALRTALEGRVPYVGLVASRKRGEAVLSNLRALGVAEEDLVRVKVPAGLDIGARRGDEIALSIMAEIVQKRRQLERVAWPEQGAASDASREVSGPAGGGAATEVAAAAEPESEDVRAGPSAAPGATVAAARARVTEPHPEAASEEAPDRATEAAPETATDPVCGMTVKVESARATFEHAGTTYYFCCGGCKARFEADPEAYVSAMD